MKQETVEIQKELFNEKKSAFKKYQELIIGKPGIGHLIAYELIILFTSWIPGALGMVLRKVFYPMLIGKTGRNVTFGRNVVLRHPHKINIGDNVVIDDNVVLDAKGQDNQGIILGDGVFLGRGTIFNCKNGDIVLADNVNMGFNCHVFSASKVTLGENALIAANCYFMGGTHKYDKLDVPPLFQERESRGITVGSNIWLGANVQVMDGVTIGHDVIVGTSAVINGEIPDYAIAVGIPARVVRDRRDNAETVSV